MLKAPLFAEFKWLIHGFGQRDSVYPEPITTVKQIHSDRVIAVAGAGGDRIAEADGLVTAQPGLVVGVRTADCVPVLLADARRRAVAAVHAGWRGSARNIVGAAVQELITRFGSQAEDLYVAIGPSIGRCCYEVGHEVGGQFREWAQEPGTRLDLPAINAAQLRAAGVRHTWIAGECTYCEGDRYFSFRREKEQAGRMLSWIGTRG